MAAHLAVAVTTGRQRHHQNVAPANRTVIGQAQGMIMITCVVDAATASACLRRLFQSTQRKISVIAPDIATTRRMPTDQPPPGQLTPP